MRVKYDNAMYHADGNETIEGVAICYPDGKVVSLEKPNRHHHVIKKIFEEMGMSCSSACTQGFITNTGRFVSRVEARMIAIDSGQIDPNDTLHGKQLFSEDLW